MFRIGHGLDVHAFADNRRLIIGGVEIPAERGLIGHSDADVLTHAIMDALLGAIGESDIGVHFPDTDAEYKDACSISLLKKVMELVQTRGFSVVNCDSSVLLEAPKLSPHRDAIRATLANALGIAKEDCTVKATTMERLGFIGREEGVIASSVVLLSKASQG